MAFDPEKDKILKKWECEETGLVVSINQYGDGEPKLQIGPRIFKKKDQEAVRLKADSYVVKTDGFDKFENAKQLCSYVGITPTIRESGSSVRGRSRISKVGNRKLRNLLFLCSFTACKHNKGCREVYERIVNKGKSKKLALITVSNKLIKQSFAIAKSGNPYDEKYVSVLPK